MITITVLAALVALIATALLAPIRVDVEIDTRRSSGGVRARVEWLFVSWKSGRTRRPSPRRPPAPKPVSAKHRGGPNRLFAMLRTPGFVPRLVRAIVELAGPLRPVAAEGQLTFGLDDPALTGECLGVLCAMRVWPGRVWRDVRIVPDFERAALEASGRASWVIRPARVLWPVISLAAAPAAWRAIAAAVRKS